MAQKVQVVLVDDIDGGKADETVQFALDGVGVRDRPVAEERGQAARRAAPSTSATAAGSAAASGRRRGRGRARSGQRLGRARSASGPASNGYKVSDRGRVPAEVREAYRAAH